MPIPASSDTAGTIGPDTVTTKADTRGPRPTDMLLLISSAWPERALVRAQLEEDTRQQVMATDTVDGAVEWLSARRFALVILDTHRIAPDDRLLEPLRSSQTPVVVLVGAFDRDEWQPFIAGLNVRSVVTRPIRIGDLSDAIRHATATG